MKPLLRAVLIIDAVLLLAFGVLFVLMLVTAGVSYERRSTHSSDSTDDRAPK
jgi:hypothetical protein